MLNLILGYGTVALTVVVTLVVMYGLVLTARYPRMFIHKRLEPNHAIPDWEFMVSGDDIVGLY